MNTTTRIPKLFLTAQAVNPPRFPLQLCQMKASLINIRLTFRYSAGSYAFAVKGFCTLFYFGVQDQVRYTTGNPSSKYEHQRASALLRNIQNKRICMGLTTAQIASKFRLGNTR